MIIRTSEQLQDLISELSSSDMWAYDLETSGLNVRKNEITDIALYNGKNAFNIVHKEYVDGELKEVVAASDILPILEILKSKKLRMHNSSFDCRFTFHYFNAQLWPAIHQDSMLMAHAENENRFNYGLKELATDIFGGDSTAERSDMLESIKSNGGGPKEYFKADSNIRAAYAMKDVKLTWDLCEFFEPKLAAQGLTEFFMTDETMPLYRDVIIPMELKGIPVNVPLLEKTQKEIAVEIERLETEIQSEIAPRLANFNSWFLNKDYPVKKTGPFAQALACELAIDLPRTKSGAYSFTAKALEGLQDGTFKRFMVGAERLSPTLVRKVQESMLAEDGIQYPFNLSSKHHLKKLFFEELGEVPTSTTDLGNPQVEDDFIELMSAKYPWAAKLRTFNKLNKIKSTYIDTYLENAENGIFYPGYKLHGTVSGRLSGNIQQLPRPLEEGQVEDPLVMQFTNLIRTFFISGPDKIFVDVDYAQLEPTVFSHVSNDLPLQNVFRTGVDFYSQVIIEMNNLQGKYSADKKAENYLGKANKPLRNFAKTIALGFPYGYTPYKLHKETGKSESECQRDYNNYFKAFPNLAKWMKETKIQILETETVRTQSGRVRRFPGIKSAVAKYGMELFDGLELWKKYHEHAPTYEAAKKTASWVKNSVNSSYNFQIQGLAASIVNRAAIQVARELRAQNLDAYICLQVHDELAVLCREEDKLLVGEIMQRQMENTYTLSVPLVAEPSYGYTYAESKG